MNPIGPPPLDGGDHHDPGAPLQPFVITGASGGGKSTLIAALAALGYATQPEIGRRIVREQLACGGAALPWADRRAFRDALLERSLAAYDAWVSHAAPVFFDRSFAEALGYGALIGDPPCAAVWAAARARPFAQPVFVCPMWPEIFTADAERRHDLAFAEADLNATLDAYRALGCLLVDVPRVDVAKRVAFILATAYSTLGR
jgi:predicted ATPase